MQKKVARISCDESLNPEDLNKAQFGQLISPGNTHGRAMYSVYAYANYLSICQLNVRW